MRVWIAMIMMGLTGLAQAAIKTEQIDYKSADGTKLVGYYAYDDAVKGPRPGVLVVHEWWGLNDYAKRRARDLAALGYSAMAIDMYGEGKNTEHPKDAMAFMQAALKDSDAADKRFDAGLEQLKKQPQTDPKKIAAIGYCFGGKIVLDAARRGAARRTVAGRSQLPRRTGHQYPGQTGHQSADAGRARCQGQHGHR
ncbi:Dienelactone hydrolase [Pseudomonas savastanoi pv. glycinea]|nr:Dienelactone hydrolase [Pseudomonas savastanoi pv. glycinea]KPC28843.1 Dienelactone hydrolase [Pseudomonas savastanoi pv. glycinea]KPC45755.1 Dienelactone hydrolase [Pseudomonas savastanoi pv. glycinea]KPC46605.1 Dienelactone hydrolase [Pseudomonas savastanoi pv. glycinea]